MAQLYADAIIKGLKTWAQVPENLKPQVRELLEAKGRGDLAWP